MSRSFFMIFINHSLPSQTFPLEIYLESKISDIKLWSEKKSSTLIENLYLWQPPGDPVYLDSENRLRQYLQPLVNDGYNNSSIIYYTIRKDQRSNNPQSDNPSSNYPPSNYPPSNGQINTQTTSNSHYQQSNNQQSNYPQSNNPPSNSYYQQSNNPQSNYPQSNYQQSNNQPSNNPQSNYPSSNNTQSNYPSSNNQQSNYHNPSNGHNPSNTQTPSNYHTPSSNGHSSSISQSMNNFIQSDNIVPIAYTDGSHNAGIGGWAYVITDGKQILQHQGQKLQGNGHLSQATNNSAELTAIYQAILKLTQLRYRQAYIYSDSKYCIDSLTKWYPNWQKNGWKTANGQEVKNKELIQTIIKHQGFMKINYQHVKAHNGDRFNELADELANEGRANRLI